MHRLAHATQFTQNSTASQRALKILPFIGHHTARHSPSYVTVTIDAQSNQLARQARADGPRNRSEHRSRHPPPNMKRSRNGSSPAQCNAHCAGLGTAKQQRRTLGGLHHPMHYPDRGPFEDGPHEFPSPASTTIRSKRIKRGCVVPFGEPDRFADAVTT